MWDLNVPSEFAFQLRGCISCWSNCIIGCKYILVRSLALSEVISGHFIFFITVIIFLDQVLLALNCRQFSLRITILSGYNRSSTFTNRRLSLSCNLRRSIAKTTIVIVVLKGHFSFVLHLSNSQIARTEVQVLLIFWRLSQHLRLATWVIARDWRVSPRFLHKFIHVQAVLLAEFCYTPLIECNMEHFGGSLLFLFLSSRPIWVRIRHDLHHLLRHHLLLLLLLQFVVIVCQD